MLTQKFFRAVPLATIGLLLQLAITGAALAQNVPPVVTNVVAAQIAGTGNVRVTFDLADANGDSCYVRLYMSSNNGVSFDLIPTTATGHVNKNVFPGTGKEIIWNAAADYPGRYWGQVVAKVFVSDGVAAGGEMLPVAAGAFSMGNSGSGGDVAPTHTVTLSAYYVDKFEVTNAEFKVFIDAGGYSTQEYWSANGWAWKVANSVTAPLYWVAGTNNSGVAYPGYPVVGVSWYEADAYSRFVGKRLPTEAEWERASRGTDSRLYSFGGSSIDPSRANYQSVGAYFSSSSPTGFYDGRTTPFITTNSPSPVGAYDMCGNVGEWVNDWYDGTYYAVSSPTNPPGPVTGTLKSNRGGAFGDAATGAYSNPITCTGRQSAAPVTRAANLGFRCAKSQ